ncbi:MAG: hypothetical protein U0559_02395 [Anaerolineae bacterium]
MDLFSQILLVVLLMGYLFSVNTTLTWITLALAPFIVFAALTFRRIARNTITQSRRVGTKLTRTFRKPSAASRGWRRPFGRRTPSTTSSWTNEQSFRINRRTGYVFSAIFPILNVLAGIGTALLVYVGGLNVQRRAHTCAIGICSCLVAGRFRSGHQHACRAADWLASGRMYRKSSWTKRRAADR